MKKLIIILAVLSSCTNEKTNDPEYWGTITSKKFSVFSSQQCICDYEYWCGAQLTHYEFQDSCSMYKIGQKIVKP